MHISSDQVQFAIGKARKAASKLQSEPERWAAYDALSSVEMALTGNATSPMEKEFFGESEPIVKKILGKD